MRNCYLRMISVSERTGNKTMRLTEYQKWICSIKDVCPCDNPTHPRLKSQLTIARPRIRNNVNKSSRTNIWIDIQKSSQIFRSKDNRTDSRSLTPKQCAMRS